MWQRPSLGEFVVFNGSVDAPVFFVKLLSRKAKDVVGLYNCSEPLKPILWSKISRLRYLSQAQSMAFFRHE